MARIAFGGWLMPPIFSAFYWIFLAATSVVLFPIAVVICLVTMPFDPRRTLLHRYTCWWSQLYLRCLPGCRIQVEGREKIKPGVAYVLVANHQSMTDIMALSALNVPFKWVSKKEAFNIPVIGWNMSLNHYVCVDRGNVRNVRATMETCRAWLERGVPLMMFPEGHRSPDGEIHEFHGGAFKMAIDTGAAVVPIVVDGTWPIYRGFRVAAFPGTIIIRVLDPIPAQGNANPLRDEVFALMQRELAAMRGENDHSSRNTRSA
jgi:1-acyl-sn-glycerol-3-phosphate acyltransferase